MRRRICARLLTATVVLAVHASCASTYLAHPQAPPPLDAHGRVHLNFNNADVRDVADFYASLLNKPIAVFNAGRLSLSASDCISITDARELLRQLLSKYELKLSGNEASPALAITCNGSHCSNTHYHACVDSPDKCLQGRLFIGDSLILHKAVQRVCSFSPSTCIDIVFAPWLPEESWALTVRDLQILRDGPMDEAGAKSELAEAIVLAYPVMMNAFQEAVSLELAVQSHEKGADNDGIKKD